MPKKKKFIDKKNATTYHLIHRSQKDPLQADQDASQMVLVTGDELAQSQRKERLTTMGIFFDDDYDYEQHIKTVDDLNIVEPDQDIELFRVGSTAGSALPPEALPSKTEEEIGMLALAAPISGPRLDWHPDIVAALDSDNDFMEDELEDDFITMANESGDEAEEIADDRQGRWLREQMVAGAHSESPTHSGDEGDVSSDFGDELDDEVGSLNFSDGEDTKTRFTNYSMSSSVIRRNAGLTLLDERFEKLYEQYDESEIGGLELEDVEGAVSTEGPIIAALLEEFERDKEQPTLPKANKDEILSSYLENAEESDKEEELVKVVVDEGCTSKWDCESILSTYSNLYNHPKIIENPWQKEKKSKKIELTKKLGIPLESVQTKGLTKKQLKALDQMNGKPNEMAAPVRRKEESADEKRERKAAVKEQRKERRIEKKNTKVAFREEEASHKRQQIQAAHNLAGQRIV